MGVPIVEDFQHIFVGPLHAQAKNNTDTAEAVRDALLLSFLEYRTIILTFPCGNQVEINPDEITHDVMIRLERKTEIVE